MKKILFSEEKRRILIEERQIDLEEIVDLIEEEKIIADIENPTHQNQRIFIVDYHWYIVCIPYVEDEEKIFLKTAYPNRKFNKLFNS